MIAASQVQVVADSLQVLGRVAAVFAIYLVAAAGIGVATARTLDLPAASGRTRLARGFGWGVVATIAMSILMLVGMTTGMAPMPAPIPLAIMSTVFGEGTPQPLLMLAAVLSHFAYGGVWAGAFATIARPVTVWRGIVLGVFLWLLMQVAVLPFLGWGMFGTAVTPAIAVATLVLHLVYGATYGALMDRHAVAVAH